MGAARELEQDDRPVPTEAGIRRMVEVFYARVREDADLGPVFERHIGSEWTAHLDRMVDFWSAILLATGRYQGNPLQVHRGIPELEPAHFDRWLELFGEVLAELFSPALAANIHGRAQRMRVVLQGGLRG
jgi:hemoglobin